MFGFEKLLKGCGIWMIVFLVIMLCNVVWMVWVLKFIIVVWSGVRVCLFWVCWLVMVFFCLKGCGC